MKWEDDPLKYEKYLVLDYTFAFSEFYDKRPPSEISLQELNDFIDKFFEKK